MPESVPGSSEQTNKTNPVKKKVHASGSERSSCANGASSRQVEVRDGESQGGWVRLTGKLEITPAADR